MMGQAQCEMFARYNQWMNHKLYALCAELDDAERKQDRQAFFGSIHRTLNHIVLGDKVWLGRFQGQPFVITGLDQVLHEDFEELRAEREDLDMRILDWAGQLDTEMLQHDFEFRSVTNPATRVCPLWQAVSHFFNHQTHHRGQLTTLLSQCGVDPGVTDLLAMPGLVKELPETP